ncbi:MAG: AI-2E family transporter, partial [Lachnospiraceae bacterium]|nr:AI-2E family transporter [Lachnospiraceae bacterium]
ASKEKFLLQAKKILAAIFSKKNYKRIMSAAKETHHVFGEFISGKLVDSLVVGIAMFILMWLIGIPYAVLISVVLAVANLIPFFGQFIGIIPTALLVFVEDPVKGLIYVVVVVVYMQFDANVVSPKILGDSIGLGSFWILFSIILFGGLFGVWGMLIAVPVFAMIYRWCTRFTNRHLKKKGLPVEAFAYNSPGEDVTVPEEVVDAGKDEKNGGEQ